ncbi:unnamed protein product [Eruca vesicaria subsp. sativa]|uniref:Uncharacterized protein n=1 Tax=Eruca vesicaria subsp. sativa TaxID=29727 RepID=A0ABC8J1V2_ERUVS|nr:unnamed protein product [Eruca vesicaria subsp. sativa]
MTHYNKLPEVSYNPKITAWNSRVKIHRIYFFYSYVTSSGPFYTYVLADEEETKMEMTIYADYGFQATNSWFKLTATCYTQVHIINPLNNRLFMDFKNIHAIPHIDHMDQNYPIVIFSMEAHFNDPATPRMLFHIRDNIRIKCVATSNHASAFRDGLENMRGHAQVIVVLNMWRVWKFLSKCSYFGPLDLWLETEGGLSDFRFNPHLSEVEEFTQSLLRSDHYVQRYGAVGLL